VRVSVVEMRHSVPCVGFGVYPMKKRLLDQYRGLAGKELGQLRKQKIAFEELFENYADGFFYCGDTGIEMLEKYETEVLKFGTVIIECTFLYPVDDQLTEEAILHRCERDGHIYWPQLLPYIQKHPEVEFVLIHFSIRYSKQDIIDFFKKVENTPNVTVLASRYADQ
jgi:ribonuclease Z